MKPLAMTTNAVNSIVNFSFFEMFGHAFIAGRINAAAVREQKPVARQTRVVGLLGSVWNAITPSQSKPCNDCLIDISTDAVRCPHCRALQNNEAVRLRRRDAGWY